MKLRFIVNPCSGRHKRTARLLPLLRDFVSARGMDATIVATEGPGHATVLAREAVAAGCDRVVAVGGDGTLNETARALLRTPAALALVPCGTGNGLARHLGLPLSPAGAIALAADPGARISIIDSGQVNGWPFFNLMGLGFDAAVSRRFNKLTKRSLFTYAKAGFAAFLHRRSERCVIATDGGREDCEILLVCAANADQYGNGAVIAPGARVDDGALDLIAIQPVGYIGAAALTARLFCRSLDGSARVRRWRGGRFVIERAVPGVIHTDGEPRDAGAVLEILTVPRSLRVVVPAGTIR